MADEDGIIESLKGTSTRRKALGGLVTIVLAFVTVNAGGPKDELTEAEDELENLSTFFNQTDATDPTNLAVLIRRINQTLATVNEQLQKDDVVEARNSDSEFDSRISAIEDAVTYYTSLREALNESQSVRDTLSSSELAVFFDDVSQTPAQGISLSDVEARLAELNDSIDTDSEGKNNASSSDLLPDTESLNQQLQAQLPLYQTQLLMQQSFLTAKTHIREGTVHREREEFQQAVTSYETASEAVEVALSETGSGYSLTFNTISIDQYLQIFDLYQTGVSTMIDAAEPPVNEESDNELFNEGLASLIDARALISS